MTTNHITLVENYREDPVLRDAFFDFTETIFNLSFRKWYELGRWDDRYVCVSLFDGQRLLANVSFSRLDILMAGETRRAIQIATVGTLEEFRHRGLSRELMDYVLKHHCADADLTFLFANDTVVDFYPRFGFARRQEHLFVRDTIGKASLDIRHLDLAATEDCGIIDYLLKHRIPVTRRFGAENHAFITWWHLINLHAKSIYLCESLKAIVVASVDNGFLYVWDAIAREPFDLEAVAASLPIAAEASSIMYCFAPDVFEYQYDRTEKTDDSPLFVRGNFDPGYRLFKFPATAQT